MALNRISDPNSLTSASAASICYVNQAEYFRVNAPTEAQQQAISKAISSFLNAFPEVAWRFEGKTLIRQFKQMGHVINDIDFGKIFESKELQDDLKGAMGLV